MKRILLDTSAYSAFMRGHSEIKCAIQEADEIHVNPIVLGELLAGFIKGHRAKNEKELRLFLSSPRVKILLMDEDTSERYAIILNALWKIGNPIPTNDIWIAASAMQHGLHLLTTDAHYQKIVQIVADYYRP